MDGDHKDYAFKNEISLSIGDESLDSTTSTPSTVTPPAHPTPSPRQNVTDDTKPLTKGTGKMSKPEGIDNKAFDGAEKASGKPLTSFGSNGHSNGLNDSGANGANKNGQLNEKKLAEAVNLELININNNMKKPTATNGKHNNNDLPPKKDGDVEMGATAKDDSYDEYFVPVNEHRKYMSLSKSRTLHGVDHNGLSIEPPEYGIVNYNDWIHSVSRGEKLYVTKDNRDKSHKNRLCWIICIGLVAAVLILGILAASGAFNKSESPIEARNLKSTAANDTGTVLGAGIGLPSNSKDQSDKTSSTTTTTEPTLPPVVETTPPLPPGDTIKYVPNSLEGQITMKNAEYSTEYNDPNSPIYKKLIKDLEYEIKSALSANGNEEFFVKIIGLRAGSVVVDYRVSWKNANSEMTSDEMMMRIQNFLNKNNQQFLSRYDVNLNTIRTARVPDRCASEDMNSCDHKCEFSAELVDFECTCPDDMKYDADFKECVTDDDSIFVDTGSNDEPKSEPETSSEPKAEPEPEPVLHHHDDSQNPKSEPEPSSEPKAEPDPVHYHHDQSHSPKSEPEPSSEPKAEPEPDHHHHDDSHSPKSEPEPSSESKAEPGHHDHDDSSHNPKSEPEPSSEPKAEPEPGHHDHDDSHNPKSEPEPSSEPKTDSEHHHHYVIGSPLPKSKPEPSSEPKAEPEPSHHDHDDSHNPKSEPEPSSEPKAEPQPGHHDHDDSHNPKSEPEPSSEPKTDSEHHHHYVIGSPLPKSEPEPSSEPKAEPEPGHHDHDDSSHNPKSEPEPSSEPKTDSEHHHYVIGSPLLNSTVYVGEKKTKTLDEDKDKPVIEEVEDTPRPTENYFAISRSKDLKGEVNVFDMNSTTQSSGNTTVYATANPTHLWATDNATHHEHHGDTHDMSPYLPEAEKSGDKIYSVTENVAEAEAPHNQSPFLPELENNETLHHILVGAHGMVSDESDETVNKTFSTTVSYSNETHTDSPIVKVIPIKVETSSPSPVNGSEPTTIANEVQITSEASPSLNSTVDPNSVQESTTTTESTSTTTTEMSEEEKEKEEEENTNLFGEDVEEDESEHAKEEEAPSTSPESVTTTPAPGPSTSESHIQVLLMHQGSSDSTTVKSSDVVDASSVTPVPSTTTLQPQTTSSLDQSTTSGSTVKSVPELILTTTEQIIVSPESSTEVEKSTKAVESTEKTSNSETSTTVTVKFLESNENSKTRITLDDFKHIEESDDNSLKVIPLSRSELPTTTTEASLLTNENEVTDKTETTGHFLEQTTFPSIRSELDEASLNFRNGKILPEDFFERKNQQSLDDSDNLDKTKLFKQDFLDKLSTELCAEDKFKCALSNECISKVKICDGKAQCSDHSDEWNCFKISNGTTILQVKQEDKLLKVCASRWTTELSNKVCNKLGFSGAIEWRRNHDAINKDEKYLIVKGNTLEGFEFADSCADGLVDIQCADYECGSNSTGNTDSGEFSSISLVVNRDSSLRCTASIISPLWALTSASCVTKPEQEWILIAGSTELNMSKISKNSVISLIGNIVTFPESDFALLELKQVLPFANQIYSACLNAKHSESSKECLTTGWLTKETTNAYEKYEKIAAVERNCTSETDSICVTPHNKHSNECYNDKGAVLYCYSSGKSRWLLNGLQNKQSDCQDPSKPSIFASLTAKTIDWIKNTVGNSRMFV